MKTAEEIYNKYFHHTDDNTKRLILIIMEEYASQFKTVEPEKRAELLKEIMDTDQEHGMYNIDN